MTDLLIDIRDTKEWIAILSLLFGGFESLDQIKIVANIIGVKRENYSSMCFISVPSILYNIRACLCFVFEIRRNNAEYLDVIRFRCV